MERTSHCSPRESGRKQKSIGSPCGESARLESDSHCEIIWSKPRVKVRQGLHTTGLYGHMHAFTLCKLAVWQWHCCKECNCLWFVSKLGLNYKLIF